MNVLSEQLLNKYHLEPIEPMDFYRDIFGDGILQSRDNRYDGRCNAIAIELTNDTVSYVDKFGKQQEKTKVNRYTITDEMDDLDWLLHSDNFCFMAPISYIGKSRDSSNARYIHALTSEIDHKKGSTYLQDRGLANFFVQLKPYYDNDGSLIRDSYIPTPTYIVASGSGLHCYYVFERPIRLHENVRQQLSAYRKALTKKLWNGFITNESENIQYESLYQGFRIVGTLCKNRQDTCDAYILGDKVTPEYLNQFVEPMYHFTGEYQAAMTLQEAKEKFPDWYEHRIILGEPPQKRKGYIVKKDLYNWWLRKVRDEIKVGHRYYSLTCLAAFALKCGVPEEEYEQDCYSFLNKFKSMSQEDIFDEKDIRDAIQFYYDENSKFVQRDKIAYFSGIDIPKNKRNYQKQSDHLEEARILRDIRMKRKNLKWDENNGRKSLKDEIQKWKTKHPNGTRSDCANDLEINIKTVNKWWDSKSKSELIQEWKKENPNGTKYQCIKETGISKPTVYKYWT